MNKVTVGKSQTIPRTYSIGMIGRADISTRFYTLAQVAPFAVCAITLHGGNRLNEQVEVGDVTAITQEEMDRIAPGFEPLAPGTEITIEVGA